MEKIMMGSVNMVNGEGLPYLKEQMLRVSKFGVEQYFMDIICGPDQINEAIAILREFYVLTGELLPRLDKRCIFTAITCDEAVRPAIAALTFRTGGQKFPILDINPSRKASKR